jgi:hypothetical protein
VTEFRRLIDECDSEFGRAVLNAGRRDESDARRTRVLAALGVGAAVSMTTKASFAMSALWKKVMVGTFVAASGVAGVAAYRANVPPPSLSVSFGAPVDAAVMVGGSVSSGRTVHPEADEQVPDRVVTSKGAQVLAAPRTARASREAGLNEELALLDKARFAVRSGHPSDALARLDEHSARFPKGSLALEAQVLRVQALAGAGRREEASRRAKRILSRSPNSVVAQRLRQYVID